jgi:hypothetical protein
MSDGRLIRVVGEDGGIQYLPLIRDPNFAKYDVIVDEAPAGPNQKERTFAILSQFMPLLKDAGPGIMAEFVKYSPLPASLITKVVENLTKMEEAAANAGPSPEQIKAETELAKSQADMQRLQFDAEQSKLDLQKAQMEMMSRERDAIISERETAMREQNDARKLVLDERRLEIEERIKNTELAIKARELELREVELGINSSLERDRMAYDAASRSQESSAKQNQDSEAAKPDRSSDAVGMGLQALAEALSRPKKLVRGEDGKAVGIE